MELVSGAMHGEEMTGIGWVKLQFLPKFEDLIVDAARGGVVVVTPDISEQFFAGNDSLCVLEEEAKKLEFVSGQSNILIVLADQHFGEVNLAFAETDRGIQRMLLSLFDPVGSRRRRAT